MNANAKARRHLATRGMAELRAATTWNDVGLQGRIHKRIERKWGGACIEYGVAPLAHFWRTYVSARTLLALQPSKLATKRKLSALHAESHPGLCAHPGWFRATALANTPGTHTHHRKEVAEFNSVAVCPF